MLLIEADPAAWYSGPRVAIDRLVALRVGGRAAARYLLAFARRGAMEGELAFDNFGAGGGPPARSPGTNPIDVRRGRAVELEDFPAAGPGAMPPEKVAAPRTRPRKGRGVREIAGLVERLVRRWT